jgi:hypothetical protein
LFLDDFAMTPSEYALFAEKGKHRFYAFLRDIVLAHAMFGRALDHLHGHSTPPDQPVVGIACNCDPVMIAFNVSGSLEAAVSGNDPAWFMAKVIPKVRFLMPAGVKKITALQGYNDGLIYGLFVLHCEAALEWVRARHPDYNRWPPVANFVRVVRNALVHGGTINIDSPTAPTVSWRGVTYDRAQKGRHIKPDLNYGDLIILLFELDEELNNLGAPLDLN